jgi:hypothetical protein
MTEETNRATELQGAEYTPMPEAAAPEAPETFKSDADGLRQAAKELGDVREERAPPTPRQYVNRATDEPRPLNETVSLQRAADDLKAVREGEEWTAARQEAEQAAAAVDQFRNFATDAARPEPSVEQALAQELQAQPDSVPEPAPVNGVSAKVQQALSDPDIRSAIEAQVSAAEQARQQYTAAIDGFMQNQDALLLANFPELKNVTPANFEPVLQAIASQNPQRAQAIVSHIQQARAAVQLAQQHRAVQQQQAAAQMQHWMAESDRQFDEAIAKSEPAHVVKQVRESVLDVLTNEYKIDRSELEHMWRTNPLMHSPAVQQLIFDSVRFRLAQKAAREAAPANIPQVLRPGTAGDRTDAQSHAVGAALRSFHNDANPKTAAKLLAARRNAARSR